MNSALLYLYVRQRRSTLVTRLRSLRSPLRLLLTLLVVALLGFVVFGQLHAVERMGAVAEKTALALTAMLAFFMVMGAVGGLLVRGLFFTPAEVDLLFPGPFTRAELLAYRLLSLYPVTILSSAFLSIYFATHLPHPFLAFLGMTLCQLITVHVQALASLGAAAVGERLWKRYRSPVQLLFMLVTVAAIGTVLLLILHPRAGASFGTNALESPVVRVVFWPAAAAGRLGLDAGAAEQFRLVGGLVVLAVATFWLATRVKVDYLEAALATSQRLAAGVARARRGISTQVGDEDARYRLRLPMAARFGGAGALVWRNLTIAIRSPRVLLFALVFATLFGTLAVAAGRGGDDGTPRGGAGISTIVMALLLPFMMQAHLAFDFRRDVEHMAELKALPLRSSAVAFAQILVPTLLALVAQAVVLIAASLVAPPPLEVLLFALPGVPLVTFGIFAIVNAGFLLFPVRSAAGAGRAGGGAAAAAAVVHLLALVVSLVPAGLAFGLGWWLAESWFAAMAAALAAQLGVDVLLVRVNGRLFERFDVSRDVPA